MAPARMSDDPEATLMGKPGHRARGRQAPPGAGLGERRSPLPGVLLGAVAGIAGTVAMTVAMRALYRRLPPPEQYPLPPREIVQRVLHEPGDRAIPERARQDATLAAHFGYGAATGALYALARPSEHALPGAVYGVLVWAVSYLGWIPSLGVLRQAARHPRRRNALMIAAHLVWGATLAATLRELERAEAEIFAHRAAKDPAPDAHGR